MAVKIPWKWAGLTMATRFLVEEVHHHGGELLRILHAISTNDGQTACIRINGVDVLGPRCHRPDSEGSWNPTGDGLGRKLTWAALPEYADRPAGC